MTDLIVIITIVGFSILLMLGGIVLMLGAIGKRLEVIGIALKGDASKEGG